MLFPKFHTPYGANLHKDGTIFSFTSRGATGARLLLYDRVDDLEPSRVINYDPNYDRFGDLWSLYVPNLGVGTLYHLQVDGPYAPESGDYFNGRARLIDPYARALAGDFLLKKDGVANPPKCVVLDDEFDWSGDVRIKRNFADEIIYEIHTRGFTQSATSNVEKKGTYLGLIEKIPYIQSLGVTAVELMPIHEFPRNETNGEESIRKNYWGYDPIAFFAPHRGYAWSQAPGAQTREFKQMVKEFHRAGLEVYLDVVFNHTAERGREFDTFSFKGFDNRDYYTMKPNGDYENFSGCGNTVNANSPRMRELILDCLRSWVCNYHIDGFRFDLASILSRDRQGQIVWNPPVLNAIAEDPILADVKIIAEAWDAGGAYQVGRFAEGRWAEWNGKYRDDVRKFWRGDAWSLSPFVTRLGGSSDLYQHDGRAPSASVNFITSHDGFTLNDLVSYNEKHNEDNGEENRDGDNNNFSYNFGYEGPTDDPACDAMRARQIRNYIATLFLSQGTPMLVAGDEIRRSQRGNNNAYCQDSSISWFDWSLVDAHADLKRFCVALIRFRREEATLRRRDFFSGTPQTPDALPDVSWFAPNGGQIEWNNPNASAFVALIPAINVKKSSDFPTESEQKRPNTEVEHSFDILVDDSPNAKFDLLIAINASSQTQSFIFPEHAKQSQRQWRLFVDTSANAPNDVYPEYDGPQIDVNALLNLPERSTRVYIAQRARH